MFIELTVALEDTMEGKMMINTEDISIIAEATDPEHRAKTLVYQKSTKEVWYILQSYDEIKEKLRSMRTVE